MFVNNDQTRSISTTTDSDKINCQNELETAKRRKVKIEIALNNSEV